MNATAQYFSSKSTYPAVGEIPLQAAVDSSSSDDTRVFLKLSVDIGKGILELGDIAGKARRKSTDPGSIGISQNQSVLNVKY